MTTPQPLALTMGDPAGVGPQITLRAWQVCKDLPDAFPFFVIGDFELYQATATAIGDGIDIFSIDNPHDTSKVFSKGLPVLHAPCPTVAPGKPDAKTADAIVQSIKSGVQFIQQGKASALVTNPISKALLYKTGFEFPGHTEFLAELAAELWDMEEIPLPVMMLVGGGLRVSLATIHQSLASVPEALTKDLLERIARITHSAMKTDFGFLAPRIAMAGLNPHAGEDGALGEEETHTINPTATTLRKAGINISDALPGDTVFHAMLQGDFDAIIAMYHDQGLIPVKTLDIWGGVNTTLGLPFIRTSPDHGTGYDAAAGLNARADSLVAAIKLAQSMAANRQRAGNHG